MKKKNINQINWVQIGKSDWENIRKIFKNEMGFSLYKWCMINGRDYSNVRKAYINRVSNNKTRDLRKVISAVMA